ncbi:arginine--tRNA ligase, chloroplastic/mitochondrial [Tanacetum coccineum]
MEDDYNWPELEEISNLFEALLQEEKKYQWLQKQKIRDGALLMRYQSYLVPHSLDRCLEEEAEIFLSTEKEHDDHPRIRRPRDVGKAIKKNLPDSAIDMIEGQPFVFDIGFVTFSLSPKWMGEMVDTWAPKLPAERVLVKYPSLGEEIHTGLFRRSVIAETLVRMLSHSKVDATMNPTIEKDSLDSHLDILQKWFSIEERSGGDLVIGVEDKPPFILAKKDLNHLYNDLEALRYGFEEESADWIVYVTPVRQQEYIEMLLNLKTGSRLILSADGTSYVGYRTCNIDPKELASLLDEVEACCNIVAQARMLKLLGYNAKSVSDCVLRHTFLKDPRLANCTFTSGEMVGEEGNTFLYLLKTRAKIRLIVEQNKRWGECEERALELHLLEFTEALERSCSYISPHILCDYLYELSKQFTNYSSSACKEKFSIPGESANSVLSKLQSSLNRSNDVNSNIILEKEHVDCCITPCFVYASARDPFRNSRFEVFSIRSFITKVPKFEWGKMFGFIAVSDKYGSIPDGGSHIFEPDFAYVPLFDHEWFHPIDMHNREYICLGNPSSPNSVAFSSSIEINMEIYVTDEEKKACFEVGYTKVELDLLNIWSRNLGSKCGLVKAKGEDGFTEVYYMLIKDAVDAAVEMRYKSDRGPRKVRAQIYAYYGSDILDHCLDRKRPCYWALLFRSDVGIALEELGDKIPLRKAVMAVPKGAPLKIFATLYDIESEEWILDGICELSSLIEGNSKGRLEGTGCSLSLKVDWTYQDQYL